MSWKSQRALERIFSTFKRLKNNIYDKDIQALKDLNEELENAQKRYVNDNILFAKLGAIHLKLYLNHYGDINAAKNKLQNDLALPMSFHIESLKEQLNQNDMIKYFESIGLNTDHLKSEDTEKEKEILNKKQQEIIKKLQHQWTYEKVESSLYNTCNDYLKDLDNYA